MSWWAWLIMGILLLGAEAVTPGLFFLFFFGVSGIIIGALVAAGLGGPAWLQFLLFSIFAVVLIFLFRGKLLELRGITGEGDTSDLIGGTVKLTTDIASQQTGKGDARGTSWNVKNISKKNRTVGEECKIVASKGITLIVDD